MNKNLVSQLIIGLQLLVTANCTNAVHDELSLDALPKDQILAKANFTTINEEIFAPKCLDCHSGSAPEGDIDMGSYEALMAENIIVPFDASSSQLYFEVVRKNMPQDGPALDANELAIIKAWIDKGAPNDGPVANVLPLVNAGLDIEIFYPQSTATLTGNASDSDGSIASYSWRFVIGPSTPAMTNIQTATLSLANLIEGRYLFTLDVLDNSGGLSFDSVSVQVSPIQNLPPNITAGSDANITLPTDFYTVGDFSASDTDGTVVAYQWSQKSGPNGATLTNATSPGLIASNLQSGLYEFQFTATDDDGATSNVTLRITVNAAVNEAPIANAGGDVSVTDLQSQLNLMGGGFDSDGSISSYQWEQVPSTTLGLISGRSFNEQELALANVPVGTYSFTLVVTDNDGASSPADTVNIYVNSAGNQVPTVDADTGSVNNQVSIQLPASTKSINGSASDSMGGTIASYSWTQLAGGPTSVTLGGQVSATGLSSQSVSPQLDLSNITTAGIYNFQLLATDNGGAVITDTVSLTVTLAANQSPVANAGANIATFLSSITLNGSGTDADGTVVGYLWALGSGPNSPSLSGTTSNILSVSSMIDGIYVFNLTVTDDRGGTDTQSVQITKQTPSVTYAEVSNILIDRCVDCHSPGGTASNKGNLDSYAGVLEKVDTSNFSDPTLSLLYSKVLSGAMPKGNGPSSNPLTDVQKNTIRDWILGGALNN